VPSGSVEVAAFTVSPARATIDTPGSGRLALAALPDTWHPAGACCASSDSRPAVSVTTPAAATRRRLNVKEPNLWVMGILWEPQVLRLAPSRRFACPEGHEGHEENRTRRKRRHKGRTKACHAYR
jgi:hypothetical protein